MMLGSLRHFLLLRTLPRVPRMNPLVVLTQSRRTILTDEFLGMDAFSEMSQKAHLKSTSAPSPKAKLQDRYSTSGLKHIFSSDLETFMLLADTPEEAEFMGQLLKTAHQPGQRRPMDLDRNIHTFFKMCKALKMADLSKEIYQDEHVAANLQNAVRTHYLMTLYEAEKYQEVLEETFGDRAREDEPLNGLSVGCAAAHRLGTEEALGKLMDRMPLALERFSADKRMFLIVSHLAIKLGEYAFAFDLLLKATHLGPAFNFKVTALMECGRLDEAIALLRLVVTDQKGGSSGRGTLISFDVIKRLVEAAKQEFGTDSKQITELTELCDLVDKVCDVQEKSLEELAMSPMEPNRKIREEQRKRDKPRRRQMEEDRQPSRRVEDNEYQEEGSRRDSRQPPRRREDSGYMEERQRRQPPRRREEDGGDSLWPEEEARRDRRPRRNSEDY